MQRTGSGRAADEAGRNEKHGFVGQARVKEGAEYATTAFDEDIGHVAAAEFVEDGGK